MKKSISGNLVKFTFDDNVPPLTFDCTKMSGANRAYAIPFAMCHRLGDAAAIPKSDKDGNVKVITEAMRRAEVASLAEHYESGSVEWNMKGTRAPAQNAAILTLATKLGKSYEQTEAYIANLAIEELSA